MNNIFSCEKKKSNKLPGRSYGGGHKLRRQNSMQRFDANETIQSEAELAPEEGPNILVWKWDTEWDKYDYQGCTPDLAISQDLPVGIMDAFFEDIKSVKDYSHSGLGKYIGQCMCAWCIILYLPFLCYGCCYSAMCWQNIYLSRMASRKLAIEKKMREYEKNVLHPIRQTLNLDTPLSQAYIILTDTSIPTGPVNYGTPVQNMHVEMDFTVKKIQVNPQMPSNQQPQQDYYSPPLEQQN